MKLYALLSELLLIAALVSCVITLRGAPLQRLIKPLYLALLAALALSACTALLVFAGWLELGFKHQVLMELGENLAMPLLVGLVAWQFNCHSLLRFLILALMLCCIANLWLALPLLTESMTVLMMALIGRRMLSYPAIGSFYLSVAALALMAFLPLLPAVSREHYEGLFHLDLALLAVCMTVLLHAYLRFHQLAEAEEGAEEGAD